MTATPLPMDREAVLERMARAKWEQYRKVDGQNRVPREQATDVHKEGIREEVAAYLDASGLMPHLEALQAELRHLKGRPGVPGKPLELQSRDELLAAVQFLIETQEAHGRALVWRVEELEVELALKDAALKGLIRQATSPAPSNLPSPPTNSPTDQPEE